MENLQEKLTKLETRYDEIGQLSYWYLQDLKEEYGKDPHFDDLVDSVIHSLKNYENFEQRKNYAPKHLMHLYNDELD